MFCIFVLIVFGIFELYFFHVLRIATFNGVILLGVTQRSLMIGMYLYN
jgi:membrane-associated HD superfamily phosphohydrolase